MSEPNQKQHDDSGFGYQIDILQRMVNELAEPDRSLILKQLDRVVHSIRDFTNELRNGLDDIHLKSKLAEFDLDMTRQERDDLRDATS